MSQNSKFKTIVVGVANPFWWSKIIDYRYYTQKILSTRAQFDTSSKMLSVICFTSSWAKTVGFKRLFKRRVIGIGLRVGVKGRNHSWMTWRDFRKLSSVIIYWYRRSWECVVPIRHRKWTSRQLHLRGQIFEFKLEVARLSLPRLGVKILVLSKLFCCTRVFRGTIGFPWDPNSFLLERSKTELLDLQHLLLPPPPKKTNFW